MNSSTDIRVMTGNILSPTGLAQKSIDFIVDTGADLTMLQSRVE
jgi:hypothetical protein